MILKEFKPGVHLADFVQCYRIVHFKFDKSASLPCKIYPPKPENVLHFFFERWLCRGRQQRRENLPATHRFFRSAYRHYKTIYRERFFKFTGGVSAHCHFSAYRNSFNRTYQSQDRRNDYFPWRHSAPFMSSCNMPPHTSRCL